MKKFIAIASLSLAWSLTAPHAFADDTSKGSQPGQSDSTTSGTTGSTGSSDSSMSQPGEQPKDMSKESTTESKDKWATAKTCTDASGNTYKRGKKGFDTCVESMKKQEQSGQAAPSGQAGGHTGSESSTGQSMPGTSGSGTSDTGSTY